MKGHDVDISGGEELTAEEQAILAADENNNAPVARGGDAASIEDAAPQEIDAEGNEAGDAEGEATEAEPKQGQRSKTVPHEAFHQERRLRQEAERRGQLLEERFNMLLQQVAPQQQQQAQEAPMPEWDKDPAGRIAAEFKRRDDVLLALTQAVSGQTRQAEQSNAVAQLSSRVNMMEQEFKAEQPDYPQALEYLIDHRRRELAAAGWTDPAEINAFMANEALALAQNVMSKGGSAPKVYYELAKIRGYQAGAAPTTAAADQIATIARGQQQARGINKLPGQATTPVNARAIADMNDEEFAAWIKKATPAQKRQVFGA